MTRCGERIGESHKGEELQPIRRYLGLSVGGAKSDRTCLTVIDHYHNHGKAFVVDIFEAIGAEGELTSDQVLLELIDELSHEIKSDDGNCVRIMGVDAPLTLPPCLLGCEESCTGYEKCRKPEVRWMRAQYLKAKAKNSKLKHFTPYGQRPVDLYFRYKHAEPNLFQDETMGANLAPQAARMSYLIRRLPDLHLIETWPKLALYNLVKPLKLSKREVLDYRHIERGASVRTRVLERLVEKSQLFIYERDMKKLVMNLDGFDSFICAWVAMMTDLERVVEFKSDLPLESGWIQIPEL